MDLCIRNLIVAPPIHRDSCRTQQIKVLILLCAFWNTFLASHDNIMNLDHFDESIHDFILFIFISSLL